MACEGRGFCCRSHFFYFGCLRRVVKYIYIYFSHFLYTINKFISPRGRVSMVHLVAGGSCKIRYINIKVQLVGNNLKIQWCRWYGPACCTCGHYIQVWKHALPFPTPRPKHIIPKWNPTILTPLCTPFDRSGFLESRTFYSQFAQELTAGHGHEWTIERSQYLWNVKTLCDAGFFVTISPNAEPAKQA